MADRTEESIHAAVRSGNIQIVREVLRRNPSCVNYLDQNFNSPLHLNYNHVNPFIGNSQTDDRLPILQLLIKSGTNVNIRNRNSMTPLFSAIEKHQINGIKILLDNKADPNIRQDFNRTPLIEAVDLAVFFKKDDKIIKLLLDYNADPNLTDCYGQTALDHAICQYKLNYVQLLLASGARVKNIYRSFSRNMNSVNFFQLPKEDYSIWIDFLLSHVDHIAKRGQFSLSNLDYNKKLSFGSAIEQERIHTFLESLRNQGIHVVDSNYRESKLHEAVRENEVMLVEALLQKTETDVNALNVQFDTPLHLLFNLDHENSCDKIGCLLLSAGANWRIQNLVDETAFYLAVNKKRHLLVNLMLYKIARVDNSTFEPYCNLTCLPKLSIRYSENDITLHELLVAISLDCEPVIDRLLDEAYNIDEASKRCRQDTTIALVKAIQLNNCNIVKKLLQAGFRTDGRLTGDLFDLISTTGDKIRLSCLLWEFNDRQSLVRLFYNTVYDYSSNSNPNVFIYLLLFYFAIDEHINQFVPDLIWLQASLKWQNLFKAKFTECKNEFIKMKNLKLSDVSVFNIMTMKLNSLVKLLNNKHFYDNCTKKVLELQTSSELKYYDIALQYRLELALEKNEAVNIALHCLNYASKTSLSRTNITSLPYEIECEILSNLNMSDLKKLALN